LQGCRVSVVTDGLKGKSLWWQKGPLLISHPQRTLLQGEAAFYLFTEHAAAKEQWMLALQWASSRGSSDCGGYNALVGAGGTTHTKLQQQHPQRQLTGLYAAFCGQMRSALAAHGQLQVPQAANSQQAAAPNSNGCQPHPPLPRQSASTAAVQDASGKDFASLIDLASVVHASEDCIVGLSVSSSGTSKAAATKAQPREAQVHGHGQGAEFSADPVNVPADSPGGLFQQKQQQQHFAACSLATEQSAAPGSATVAAAAAAAVQSDTHGLNVLLSRVAFELLQSSEFEGRLGGAVQQWLDGIRRPAYLDR
jgi:hypothetical protein